MNHLITGLIAIAAATVTHAGLIYSDSPNHVIPDANAAGYTMSTTIGDQPGGSIDYVRVHLNLQGGWNGDLYAHLTYTAPGGSEPTAFAVLLNRIGKDTASSFGSGTSGMDVWLSASGPDIHTATSTPLVGDFSADGRAASPLLVTGSSPRDATLASFAGVQANGKWDLFFADMSAGSQTTVQSWELDLGLTTVPEPVGLALGVFGGLFALATCINRMKRARHENITGRDHHD